MAPARAPRPPVSRRGDQQKKPLPWVVLGVGLATIVALFAAMRPKNSSPAETAHARVPAPASATPAAPAVLDPNDMGVRDASAVDPMDVLGRAKTRALAWNRDALLVSLHAAPLASGHVNLKSGGTIEYWFGKPTGEGFGPGSRVAGKRFHIKLDSSGTTAGEVAGAAGRAALEPNCPLEDALRKAQAAGIPATMPVSVAYEVNEKRQKPVWRIGVDGNDTLTRILDGFTCAIFVR